MPFQTPFKPLNDLLNFAETYMPESIAEVDQARIDALLGRISKGETLDKVLLDVRRFIIGEDAIKEWASEMGIGNDALDSTVANLISGKTTFNKVRTGGEFGEGDTTQALPKNAKLVKVGNTYRVIWDLGDGMGWAWYSADKEDLKKIYGENEPQAHLELANASVFERRFGKNYWGDLSEINLRADTPWDDLKEKIFSSFGWVPGLDDPEVRRTILQGFFEGWNETQFTVEYRKTNYFNTLTDTQRKWVGLSEAERAQRTQSIAVELAESYKDIWGEVVPLDDDDIQAAAMKIASGQDLLEKWKFDQRKLAGEVEGTPESVKRDREQRDLLAEGNKAENLALYAENQWREWVGPGGIPKGFGKKWGDQINAGTKSEADLENYLKSLSSSRWAQKPPDLTWQDWATPYKSQIQNTLELSTLDDEDRLLNRILNQDISGQDLNVMIRQDERFRKTQGLYNELSGAASNLSRQFGFTK